MQQSSLRGNALVEYGIIFGLVALLSLGGLKMFGGNLNQLFGNSHAKLASSQMQDYTNLRFQGGNTPSGQNGNSNGIGIGYTPQSQLSIDPATGLPSLGIADTTGTDKNSTSVEGSIKTGTYQTLAASRQLEDLLPSISDPAASDWATKIAKVTHYMAGAAGDQAGIPQLVVQSVEDSGIYGYTSAMRDVYNYRNQLSILMSNPPANVPPTLVAKVNTLAAEAWNGSQPMISKVSPYIDASGNLDTKALGLTVGEPDVSSTTYEQVSNYTSLKNKVNAALNASHNDTPVQSTLQAAHDLQSYDSAPSQP